MGFNLCRGFNEYPKQFAKEKNNILWKKNTLKKIQYFLKNTHIGKSVFFYSFNFSFTKCY